MVPAAMVRPLRERRRRHGPLAASGEVGSTESSTERGMCCRFCWSRFVGVIGAWRWISAGRGHGRGACR